MLVSEWTFNNRIQGIITMRYFTLATVAVVLLLSTLAGCTFNTWGDGHREVEPGVPQEGPTANPADASRGQNGSGELP